MDIVADTNTFLAVTLNEPEREFIIISTVGHELIAPEILPFEIGNALSAMVKRNRLSAKEAMLAWKVANKIPVDLRRLDIQGALSIALQYSICAYDAYFIECAIRLRAPLLTLDRQLSMVAQRHGVRVLEVGK